MYPKKAKANRSPFDRNAIAFGKGGVRGETSFTRKLITVPAAKRGIEN